MQKENIIIEGHIGTWYIVDESEYKGRTVYLLEHEEFGDMAPCIIVDENLNAILVGCHNGFLDLDELEE